MFSKTKIFPSSWLLHHLFASDFCKVFSVKDKKSQKKIFTQRHRVVPWIMVETGMKICSEVYKTGKYGFPVFPEKLVEQMNFTYINSCAGLGWFEYERYLVTS